MTQPQWTPQQEAEAFARVWQRVSPDPDASPIQADADPPVPSAPSTSSSAAPAAEDPIARFLREQITAEAVQWRRCRALAQQTRQPTLRSLAQGKLLRIRRLAAALFLHSQVWYFPISTAPVRGSGRGGRQSQRRAYAALFQGAQTLARRCQSAARQADGFEAALFRELTQELAQEARVLLSLLSGG